MLLAVQVSVNYECDTEDENRTYKEGPVHIGAT
jgi:hypothetical protein